MNRPVVPRCSRMSTKTTTARSSRSAAGSWLPGACVLLDAVPEFRDRGYFTSFPPGATRASKLARMTHGTPTRRTGMARRCGAVRWEEHRARKRLSGGKEGRDRDSLHARTCTPRRVCEETARRESYRIVSTNFVDMQKTLSVDARNMQKKFGLSVCRCKNIQKISSEYVSECCFKELPRHTTFR